jgi:hypothetical protein
MFESSIARLILWVLFLILIYNVLIDIITFLGLDAHISRMYVYWFSVLLFFISIIVTSPYL